MLLETNMEDYFRTAESKLLHQFNILSYSIFADDKRNMPERIKNMPSSSHEPPSNLGELAWLEDFLEAE